MMHLARGNVRSQRILPVCIIQPVLIYYARKSVDHLLRCRGRGNGRMPIYARSCD